MGPNVKAFWGLGFRVLWGLLGFTTWGSYWGAGSHGASVNAQKGTPNFRKPPYSFSSFTAMSKEELRALASLSYGL